MNLQMSVASAVAFTLLHSVWELALVALLAALSFAALRRASASLRHGVGMGWLVAMVVAPVATFAVVWQAPSMAAPGEAAWRAAFVPGVDTAGDAAALLRAPSMDWLYVCLAQVWLVGVVVMAVRQVGGWRLLLRIEQRDFVELPPPWLRRVEVLRAALGITRHVAVRLAAHVTSPFTAHVLRPLVWLPLSLLAQCPADQVEALLAHELAHIRRLDWCWNALQCVIETVLFHHPAMWWLSRRIREEREHACDDLAVAVCGDAIALAEALARLQRLGRRFELPRPGLAANGGSLMKRITHLLSGAPARPGWRLPAALLLLTCSGTLVAMQVTPPAHLLVNLTSDESSTGALTSGNYRDFKASFLGEKPRHYRIAMDAQGRVSETYEQDGVPRPIDGGVRQWVAAMSAMAEMSTTPALPALPGQPTPSPLPPLPALEALPAVPAMKPLPAVPALKPLPSVPALPSPPVRGAAESGEFADLIHALEADSRLIALTGVPVTYDRETFHGQVHIWGSRDFHLWGIDDPVGGKANFTMRFAGPKGRVDVAYDGKTSTGGAWKAQTLALSPVAD